MLNPQAILDAARRAAGAASCPAEVLLFGSYARGDADEGSDLDLMVIEDQVDDKTAEYLKIHRAVGSMGVGVDIVVISREDFERWRQVPGTVPYWAAKEGRRIQRIAHGDDHDAGDCHRAMTTNWSQVVRARS